VRERIDFNGAVVMGMMSDKYVARRQKRRDHRRSPGNSGQRGTSCGSEKYSSRTILVTCSVRSRCCSHQVAGRKANMRCRPSSMASCTTS
jgi:hypothetical protein